jgi:hypothetical protein
MAQEAHTTSNLELTSNLEIWDKLRRVDPVHSKPFQRAGGFRGTAVKPSEQERLMTETFGPIGFGWGMTKPEYEIVNLGNEVLVYCTVGAWYRWNGEKSDIFWGEGGDKIATVRAKTGEVAVDDEARKKSLTDALGNALKRLGMAADIHLGRWDDSKYRDENEKFFEAKKRPDDLQPLAIEKFEADLRERLDAVSDLDALDEFWRSGVNARITEIGTVDKDAQRRMISAFSEKKNEIMRRNEGRDKEDPPADDQGHTADEEKPEDRYTADEIPKVEHWLKIKIVSLPDLHQFDAFWEAQGAPRLDKILRSDEDAHRRLKAAYVARRNQLSGEFKKVNSAPAA